MGHSEYTQVSFAGQHIYVGIDVALKSWKVAILVGPTLFKRLSVPPDPAALVRYVRHALPGGQVHTVYEAGYFGYWIHEAFVGLAVDSMVVNPADVPTSDKERRTKTDRVDAYKLARALANGELRGIYVPERLALEDRTLIRLRASYVRKQTRCKCQIKALLRFYNILPPRAPGGQAVEERYWSRAYIRWLQSVCLQSEAGTRSLQTLVEELVSLRATLSALTRDIRHLAHQERYWQQVRLLDTVSGVSPMAAMTFLGEIMSLERFKNLDRLASYVGLVPGEHSTGESEQDTGLTPRRNVALRYTLIECAWAALRTDPALLAAFNQCLRRMPKNVAIVHIARKLLSRMRCVLKHKEPYVSGLLARA